jgi:hypothetical protein
MLKHIGTYDGIKLFACQRRSPIGVFQVGLKGAFAKGRAGGQSFGVHLYAGHLAAFAVQNARDGARASAQFKHALTGLDHARQHRSSTATIGVNFMGVAMFYHWANNITVFRLTTCGNG